MAATSYPDHVWAAIREVWETTQLTFGEAAKVVAEDMGCAVPIQRVIGNRARRQCWIRSAKGLVKQDNPSLDEAIKKLHDEVVQQRNSADSADSASGADGADGAGGADNSKVESSANNKKLLPTTIQKKAKAKIKADGCERRLTAAKVIVNSRLNLARLSELTGIAMDSLEALMTHDVPNFDWDDPDGWEKLQAKVKLTNALIQQVGSLSMTMAAVTKAETMYWGLEAEDLKDTADLQAKRSAVMQDAETKLMEAREQMRLQHERIKARADDIMEIAREIETGEVE